MNPATRVLVDSNVILDIVTRDPVWQTWSERALCTSVDAGQVVINPIVYAEICYGFDTIEAVNELLPQAYYEYRGIPREAAFLAARCHARYRASGGTRSMILPDFLIGAHAVVERMALLTRDVRRYQTYFPGLTIICPGQ